MLDWLVGSILFHSLPSFLILSTFHLLTSFTVLSRPTSVPSATVPPRSCLPFPTLEVGKEGRLEGRMQMVRKDTFLPYPHRTDTPSPLTVSVRPIVEKGPSTSCKGYSRIHCKGRVRIGRSGRLDPAQYLNFKF